jgi:TPR repeat protein
MEKRDLMSEFLAEMQKEKPDLKVAFDLLQTAARENNSVALYAIGTWYLFGRYVKKNPSEAVKYFLQAIEGNNSDAYYDLAVCYEKGVGIKKNKKAAFECYLNAALLGDKQSLYAVGRCYFYGIGAPKNMHIGEIWLKHAELNGIK